MFNNGMGFGGMWFFGLLMFFIIFMLFKALTTSDRNANNSVSVEAIESPLDVLKKRYARGEIDEEEFERRKNTLNN